MFFYTAAVLFKLGILTFSALMINNRECVNGRFCGIFIVNFEIRNHIITSCI